MKLNKYYVSAALVGIFSAFVVSWSVSFSPPAVAGDIGCHGKVVRLMADHSGCTDVNGKRQLAFKTNSASNPWMCARSDMGSSMLLTAMAADREVSVYISDQNQGYSCSTLPDYSTVSYMIMDD